MSQVLSRGMLFLIFGVTACKGDANNKKSETNKPAVEVVGPIEPDVKRIDSELQRLADATIATSKDGFPMKDGGGISCGYEKEVTANFKQAKIDPASLQTRQGFPFEDVCVLWRPYIVPMTQMAWMISAGTPPTPDGLMPVMRCLRISRAEDGTMTKDPIVDGLCLQAK